MSVYVSPSGRYGLARATLYINDTFVEAIDRAPFIFRFTPKDIANIREKNIIRVLAFDTVFNRAETTQELNVSLD